MIARASLRWRAIALRAAQRRYRLQSAGVAALALIALVAFVLFPEEHFRVIVDGDTTTISGRAADPEPLVEQAGIELEGGDTVEPAGEGVLAVDRALETTVVADGRELRIRTQADTLEEMLVEVGVPVSSEDALIRNGLFVPVNETVAAPPALISNVGQRSSTRDVRVEVRRPTPFTLLSNGQQIALRSSRESVATALRDVGVRLSPGDRVEPSMDTELSPGLIVRVDRAVPLVATTPEGKVVIHTLAGTVGEALNRAGINMPLDYRLDPPAEAPVTPGMTVHVVGISQEQELEEERIESRTVYVADSSLAYGETRVVGGQDGILHRQFELVYEDGVVVSRDLVQEWYDPEPSDTTIYYSTERPPAAPVVPPSTVPIEIPEGLHVVRTLNVYATWYNAASAGRSPSDPAYGITATGVRVDRGIVAVDPTVIPLGTRLYIPGYGYAVAADTGGGIRGHMIDLGYPDGVVPDWISRWVDIYILG